MGLPGMKGDFGFPGIRGISGLPGVKGERGSLGPKGKYSDTIPRLTSMIRSGVTFISREVR